MKLCPSASSGITNILRYDFEYEDDGEEEDGDVDIENKYYNAKQMKSEYPAEAIEEFLEVPKLEQDKGEWGFKGLKQAIKLEFKTGKYDEVCYCHLLDRVVLWSCTNDYEGRRALQGAPHIRKVGRYEELLREIDK